MTVSRPRTPVATRTPSARQARNATSTPRVSGRRTSPLAGSIRSRSPATTKRSLQTASTTATTSLVGELDTHPSCTSVSKSVRSVAADGSISTTRAWYQALSPGSSDAIATMQSSSHQAASQMLSSGRPAGATVPVATSIVHRRRRVSLRSVEGLDLRDPGRQRRRPVATMPEPTASDCSASRPATTTRSPGTVGRPGMLLGDAVHDGKRPRLADRVDGPARRAGGVPIRAGRTGTSASVPSGDHRG